MRADQRARHFGHASRPAELMVAGQFREDLYYR
jgi:hypothetical protein